MSLPARRTGRRPAVRAAIAAGAVVAIAAAACAGQEASDASADLGPEVATSPGEARSDVPHLQVRLIEVTRVGEGALDVRFALRCAPDAPAPLPIGELLASSPADAGTVADVFAVDEASGKRYFVVRDVERRPVGSRELDPIAPGASRVLWTRLAAPPRAAATVTILVPRTPPFTGVPIVDPKGRDRLPPAEPPRQAGRM